MNRNVGLWIDHREAVIVTLTEQMEKTIRIVSGMEKRVRFSRKAKDGSAEDQRDRQFAGHLQKYYDRVVARIRDASSILIIGPGEAKIELQSSLEAAALGGCIVGIQTVDKMTERQIEATVREHFSQ